MKCLKIVYIAYANIVSNTISLAVLLAGKLHVSFLRFFFFAPSGLPNLFTVLMKKICVAYTLHGQRALIKTEVYFGKIPSHRSFR